jgi:hypothetical protein
MGRYSTLYTLPHLAWNLLEDGRFAFVTLRYWSDS